MGEKTSTMRSTIRGLGWPLSASWSGWRPAAAAARPGRTPTAGSTPTSSLHDHRLVVTVVLQPGCPTGSATILGSGSAKDQVAVPGHRGEPVLESREGDGVESGSAITPHLFSSP